MSAYPVTLFGYGNMGQSLCGLLAEKTDWSLCIVEKDPTRRQLATKRFSGNNRVVIVDAASLQPAELASSLVVLAVKPQDADPALDALATCEASIMLLSIMAGIPIALLKERLPQAQIARIMPSLAATLGRAASGLSFDSDATQRDFRSQVRHLGELMGLLVEVPESLIPAITGISGSAIAFVFRFIEALALAGTREGLAHRDALAVAIDVVEAAALLCKHEGLHPAELAARVSSPGGTTVEGLAALEEGAFAAVLGAAVHATAEKSRSMEEDLLGTLPGE